jgi:hypothetical protein
VQFLPNQSAHSDGWTDQPIEQFARTKAAYVTVRLLQKYDKIECTQVPPDAPLRFHHTIESRSGSGVQVTLHEAATP